LRAEQAEIYHREMRQNYMPAMFADVTLLPVQMPGGDLRARVKSNHLPPFNILLYMDQEMAGVDPFSYRITTLRAGGPTCPSVADNGVIPTRLHFELEN